MELCKGEEDGLQVEEDPGEVEEQHNLTLERESKSCQVVRQRRQVEVAPLDSTWRARGLCSVFPRKRNTLKWKRTGRRGLMKQGRQC